MRILVGVLFGLAGALVLAAAVLLAASEFAGEVVVLRTFDASEATQETRLWIVDWDGEPWLRAGGEHVSWYPRLRDHPECELERAGRTDRYRAIPYRDEATRDRVNALMAADYGWAERVIDWLRDESISIPIRLEMIE